MAFPQATPLWSSRGQIVFPKPQQHWNQSTTAVHSPSIESCTWYSWTCKAWNKQAGQAASADPKVEFCSILIHSLGLLLLMILTKVFWMGSRSQPKLCARTVLWLHNLQRALLKHWQNLLMYWMPLFLQFDRREQRHCSCFRVQMHKPLVHQWGNRGNFSWCFLAHLSIIVGEKDDSQKCLGYEIESWKHVSNVLASDSAIPAGHPSSMQNLFPQEQGLAREGHRILNAVIPEGFTTNAMPL